MKPRKSIIMISGSGRSGTTILSILMSQSADTFNLGQLRDFWTAYAKNEICTCGKSLHSCKIWSAISDVAFPDWSDADYLEMGAKMRVFMHSAKKLQDWNNIKGIDELAARHHDFISAVRLFVQACFTISGAQTLVDISKSPEIALAIRLADVADVFVLNVVRDPRAVACSWARKGLKFRPLGRMMRDWKRRQDVLSSWLEDDGLKIRRLDYGEFVRSPEDELAQIRNWVQPQGRTKGKLQFDSQKSTDISWDRQHLFPPANEKVLAEKRVRVTIHASEAWRDKRNGPIHLLALIRTFPAGIKYILASNQ